MADFVRNARMRLSGNKTNNKNDNVDEEKVEAVALLEKVSRNNSNSKSCVLCVGQTGAGKSATVRRLARPERGRAESSAGFEPMTKECEAVKASPPKQGDKRFWPEVSDDDLWVVDTVGWQDVLEEDEVLFQDLLRYLREEGFGKVEAVLWCVIPNVRRDAALTKQAGMIHQVGDNVWARTVVVCKQSMRPERDGAGAVKAAEECGGVSPKVVGYRYLSDLDNDEQMKRVKGDAEARRAFNVLNDQEVRECLVDALLETKGREEVRLQFADKQCLDCGVVEDPRLMPLHCHMESKREHGERAAEGHPGKKQAYHTKEAVAEHTGKLRRLWYGFYTAKPQAVAYFLRESFARTTYVPVLY